MPAPARGMMPTMTADTAARQQRFDAACVALGHRFDAPLLQGGRYLPVVVHAGQAWVSGQVPRVGSAVAVTGRVGEGVPLDEAQRAARICALRALALLAEALGSLDRIERVLRVGVFVQSAPAFTQHSEVADAASDLLHEVLGEAGRHVRTSVGVYQLPKDAAVELELVAAVRD